MWRIVLYLTPLTVAALLGVVALLALGLGVARARRPEGTRGFSRLAYALCLALVLYATVFPIGPFTAHGTIWWRPLHSFAWPAPDELEMVLAEVVANIAMFVPLAVFQYFAHRRHGFAWAVGCALLTSLGIEAAQYTVSIGRVVDADDVLCNTLGGLIGASLAAAACFRRSAGQWVVPGTGLEPVRPERGSEV